MFVILLSYSWKNQLEKIAERIEKGSFRQGKLRVLETFQVFIIRRYEGGGAVV